MIQPSKKWSNPSAICGPHRPTVTPTMPILNPFIAIVIGTLENSTRARCQIGALNRYAARKLKLKRGYR